MSRALRRLFGISLDEVGFERRGFRGGTPETRARIEKVGLSFLAGYHAALEEERTDDLERRLREVEPEFRGFAFEGAAMSIALVDTVLPWRRRWRRFMDDAGGDAHVYMASVGAGWAIARLPFGMRSILGRLDPLLVWLAFDGYGFHQGFFHWPRSIEGPQEVPRRVEGYGREAFDQGLGRSLWFVDGADVGRIPATVATFPESRRANLWSGVGLASTYAGGVAQQDFEALLEASGPYRSRLLQGATFAAEARCRAGNPVAHTDLACRVYCGLCATEAAELTAETRVGLAEDGEVPAYEVWRRRLQSHPALERTAVRLPGARP